MPRSHPRNPFALAFFTAALLLGASAASAYTVYLKDGSKIVAKEKYQVREGKAYIILPSGTQTFIDASQIDVEKTDQANAADYGTAVVIEGGQRRVIERQEVFDQPREQTLRDAVGRRSETRLPTREGDGGGATSSGASAKSTTATGAPDLATLSRGSYESEALTEELLSLLSGNGLEAIQVFQGTASRRPFLEIITASEGAVFRALGACANALTQLRENYGTQVEGLEILLLTPNRQRAGQFYLTPDDARRLASREIEPAEYFVESVQF